MLPDCARGRGQGAHEVGDVVRDVYGQWGDVRLGRLHGGLGRLPLRLLAAGQRSEADLYVGAGEAERTPGGPETAERHQVRGRLGGGTHTWWRHAGLGAGVAMPPRRQSRGAHGS